MFTVINLSVLLTKTLQKPEDKSDKLTIHWISIISISEGSSAGQLLHEQRALSVFCTQ